MLLFHKVKLTTEKLDFYETLVYNLLVRFIRLYGEIQIMRRYMALSMCDKGTQTVWQPGK